MPEKQQQGEQPVKQEKVLQLGLAFIAPRSRKRRRTRCLSSLSCCFWGHLLGGRQVSGGLSCCWWDAWTPIWGLAGIQSSSSEDMTTAAVALAALEIAAAAPAAWQPELLHSVLVGRLVAFRRAAVCLILPWAWRGCRVGKAAQARPVMETVTAAKAVVGPVRSPQEQRQGRANERGVSDWKRISGMVKRRIGRWWGVV
jgi:hypothetical protein